MQLKFFTVYQYEDAAVEMELNRFLRANRIVQIDRRFVENGANSFWSIVVEYMSRAEGEKYTDNHGRKRNSVDYKQVLSEDDFTLFSRLREWRKVRAADESVPVYTIFTNEQLAKIAENRCRTKAALKQIEGIGEGKIEKYAESILEIVQQLVMTDQVQGKV